MLAKASLRDVEREPRDYFFERPPGAGEDPQLGSCLPSLDCW